MGSAVASVLGFVLLLGGVSTAQAAGTTGHACGNQPDSYPAAPTGAVVAGPGVDNDLELKTPAAPGGTTFWLKPGTHTLGGDQYGQVRPKDGDVYLGAPGAVLDGRGANLFAFAGTASDVVIRNLTVRNFAGPGLWADTNDNDFLVEDNVFEDNEAEALFYEISHNLTVRGNVFRRNGIVAGLAKATKGDNFPVATIYLSESGGEPRLPARTHQVDIGDTTFEDDWGGITLWENADRFCNSPANTSTG